ncbi:hypothetical protein BDZ94DRAFT_1372398 [Collybia nuda]|uniref:Uncharacterized protein n=1 Tax=Collybia nuda TaxID=64659 RepID=A0A9P5Y4B7_9AGAR|nr:hypothetical protein BDZ94DRAFT_1372398 [Collybia nuda]
MHLIWSNLIPNLVCLWTGNFKDLCHNNTGYVLAPTVWEAIGEATANAGNTIPAAFGSRVPNIASEKAQMIAETYSIWTLYIAPTLLKGRFTNPQYYKHFIKLVRLLNLCLQFEITQDQVDELEMGFNSWVEKYEELYYNHDPMCVSTCPLTIHALLHIAPTIRAMAPVWAYWAFPMEHYCGDLLCHIKSRRFPYPNINKYVTSYPLHALTPPKGSTTLSISYWKILTATLATRFSKPASLIRKLIPQDIEFIQYGRMCHLEGGDTIQARGMVSLKSDSRDMSYMQYQLEVDKFAHQRCQTPVFELQDFFGQVLRFLVVQVPASPKDDIEADSYIYAIIKQAKILDTATNNHKVDYYKELGPTEFVDLDQVKCLVGQIKDCGKWAIIDRSQLITQVHNVD